MLAQPDFLLATTNHTFGPPSENCKSFRSGRASALVGWVRVIAGGTAPQVGNLPFYLAHRLSHWFRENPHLRLLCVVPISKDGNTVELHAWYEQHLFRDISPLAQQQPGEKPGE